MNHPEPRPLLRYVRSGIGISILRVLNAGLGLLTAILLTRLLGTDNYAVYSLATIALTIATIPISYGWGTLLLRHASSSRANGDWGETKGALLRGRQYAVVLAFVSGAIGAIVAWFGYIGFAPFVVVMLAVIFLADQLSALRMSLMRGMEAAILSQLPDMLIKPLALAICLGLALAATSEPSKLTSAFLALLAAAMVSLAAGVVMLRSVAPPEMRGQPSTFADREWLASALPIAANSGLVVFGSYVDILILSALMPAHDVGVYRIATQVATLAGLAYASLNVLAAQRFAYLRASNDLQKLQREAVLIARLSFVLSLVALAVLAATGGWLVPYAFGDDFAGAVSPMLILAVAQVVNAATGMAQMLLTMTGHERRVTSLRAMSIFASVFGCLALVPAMGIVGAALASLLANIVANVGLWLAAKRHVNVDSSILGLRRD